jgi:hypothetical protein
LLPNKFGARSRGPAGVGFFLPEHSYLTIGAQVRALPELPAHERNFSFHPYILFHTRSLSMQRHQSLICLHVLMYR